MKNAEKPAGEVQPAGDALALAERPPVELERKYFADEAIFNLEMERIYARSWLFVAHESEIPNAGDFVVRPMGRDSTVVSRDERGKLHVLLNSCMHRGNTLCKTGSGNTSNFRCSYHGWTYGTDGSLRAVPHQKQVYGQDFDKNQYRLPNARVDTWHGLIFATWDLEGPSLFDSLGDIKWYLDAMLGLSERGVEAYGGAHRFVHPGNWKLEEENAAGDGYHLEWTHRTAFELDLFGPQAMEARGYCVSTSQGHTLRVQHPVIDHGDNVPFWGYPEERWPEIRKSLTVEQASFFGGSSVVHGALFPNCDFTHVAPPHGLDAGDTQTAFLRWRMHIPVDAHTTEVWYWSFVPKDYPEEWKRSSYKLMHRQHGAGAFFDSDDVENFRRIDANTVGVKARTIPFNYRLGVGVEGHGGATSWPGIVVPQDLSEANQRAFYRRYLETMGVSSL